MSQKKSIRRLLCDRKVVGYLIHAYGLLFISKTLEPHSSLGRLEENWDFYGHEEYETYITHDSWDEGFELSDGDVVFAGDKIVRIWEWKATELAQFGTFLDDVIIETRTATGTLRYGEYGWYIEPDRTVETNFYDGLFDYENDRRIWKWSEISLVEE